VREKLSQLLNELESYTEENDRDITDRSKRMFNRIKPASRVPPDAILLSGNKSLQNAFSLRRQSIDGLRPVSRLPLFACPNKGSNQRTPEALLCVAGFPQPNR
jgi:hypothetical protein